MNKKLHLESRAFTLIELLVVVSIIGTLSTVALAALGSTRDKAKDSKKIMEVRSVDTAIKLHEVNTGTVPPNLNVTGGVASPACEGTSDVAYEGSMNVLVAGKTLPSVPRSPDGQSYCYFDYGGPNGEGATFSAKLKDNTVYTSGPATGPSGGLRPPCNSMGDVDGDGWVSATDNTFLQNVILGMSATYEQKRRGDTNYSGSLSAADNLFIQQYFLGIRTTFPACTPKAPPCEHFGDVDNDGFITIVDSSMMSDKITGSITFTPDQITRADVDGDFDVDGTDVVSVTRYMTGVLPTFPVCLIW